jgi:hypothetical protein
MWGHQAWRPQWWAWCRAPPRALWLTWALSWRATPATSSQNPSLARCDASFLLLPFDNTMHVRPCMSNSVAGPAALCCALLLSCFVLTLACTPACVSLQTVPLGNALASQCLLSLLPVHTLRCSRSPAICPGHVETAKHSTAEIEQHALAILTQLCCWFLLGMRCEALV